MAAHLDSLDVYRRMKPTQRLQIAQELWLAARALKAAAIRAEHPDWTQEQVEEAVRKVFLYART